MIYDRRFLNFFPQMATEKFISSGFNKPIKIRQLNVFEAFFKTSTHFGGDIYTTFSRVYLQKCVELVERPALFH